VKSRSMGGAGGKEPGVPLALRRLGVTSPPSASASVLPFPDQS
jgi:hypothetical protein